MTHMTLICINKTPMNKRLIFFIILMLTTCGCGASNLIANNTQNCYQEDCSLTGIHDHIYLDDF